MTGRLLFCNNASTTLAGAISNTATSLQVATGAGALFATPINGTYTGGNYLCLTLNDAATGQLFEVMHVTAVVGDTLTVVRAQEGTTALSWLAGDKVANFWTSGSASTMAQAIDVQEQAGNYAADSSGAANTITVTLDPVPASYTALLGAPIRVKLANTNTSTSVVLNANALGNLTVKTPNGGAPAIGSLVAGSIVTFAYDGTNAQVTSGYTAPASPTTSVVSTAQSVGASNSNTNYVATGAFTATIAQSTTLGQNWTVTLDAQGGEISLTINAADVLMVNGATFATGTGTTFPQGSSVTLTTDAAGHIYAVTAMTGTGTAGHLVTWTSPNILGDGGRLGSAAAQDIGIGPEQIPNMNAEGALALGPGSASGPRLLIYSGPGTNLNYFAGLGINIGQAPNCLASFVGSGAASYWNWTVGVGAYPYSAYVDVARLDQSGNLTLKGGVTVGATFNADGTISGGNAAATLNQLTGAAAPADVTASRAYGVTYTNTGVSPRVVSVYDDSGTSSHYGQGNAIVAGVTAASANLSEYASMTLFFIVPPGASYEVTNTAGGSPTFWVEG